MDALFIIFSYVQLDDTLKAMGWHDHHQATVTTAEILTVAVTAAKYFHNHHERALQVLYLTGYIPRLSVSRFNRRLHQTLKLLAELLDTLGCQRAEHKRMFAADTMPLPVCQHTYADQCRKIPRVKGYLGRCAAKKSWFCGWRLHWICDRQGFPIAVDLVPAVWHELTTIQHLMAHLNEGSIVWADGAYVSHDHQLLLLGSGLTLIPQPHKGMTQQLTAFQHAQMRTHRNAIETAHSVLERMGVQRLHAVTPAGFGLKVYTSLLALAFTVLLRESAIY